MPGADFHLEVLTPAGVGGVAVLRVSGPGREAFARTCLRRPGGAAGAVLPDERLRLVELWLGGQKVDQALLCPGLEPDGFELHLHGSAAVLDALQRHHSVSRPVPDAAQRLLQQAISRGQLALALEQTAIDFAGYLRELGGLPLPDRQRERAAALRRSRVAQAHLTPAPLVLSGRQNAGKSSLMNLLLSQERALTGPRPGLTRDPVQEPVELGGYPYLLIDTAGEGPTEGGLDRAAIDRGRAARRGAIVLLVVDGSLGPDARDRALAADCAPAPLLWLRNKSDLPQAEWPSELAPVLATTARLEGGAGAALRGALGDALRALRDLPEAGPVGGAAALDAAMQSALERL